jgi:23S rRNA (pseudouridine1915-N3)-methyltransferase
MQIRFRLDWLEKGVFKPKSFKSPALYGAFTDYCERIGAFTACEVSGELDVYETKSHRRVWVLDRSAGARVLSSEDLAKNLGRAVDGGVRELEIVVGGADGFSLERLAEMKPDLLWSFGPLTLPHELAAVVAAEQLYRAFVILKNHPYHSGH